MLLKFHFKFFSKIIIHLVVISFLLSCNSNSKEAFINNERLTEIPSHFGNAGIIRNPISPEGLTDTNLLAKIQFEAPTYNFGKVIAGTQVIHSYRFKNNGSIPLIINRANANCGCTVPEFPKEPILPNENEVIKVIFDTQGRKGFQIKKINIFANTYPSQNILELKGQIIE